VPRLVEISFLTSLVELDSERRKGSLNLDGKYKCRVAVRDERYIEISMRERLKNAADN